MTAHQDLAKAEQAMNQMTPIVIDVTDKAKVLASIKDDKSFKEADSFLVEIKRTQKRLDDERKKFTAPLDLAKKQIMDAYKPKAKMLTDAEMILKGATRKWFIAEQDRKAKEQREKEEAERKRLEEEKLNAAVELEKHGNVSQAEKVLTKPTIVTPQRVETSFDGSRTYGRKVWKTRIENFPEFLRAMADGKIPYDFIKINESEMNRAATVMKGEKSWPGVHIFEDVIMGVRR